MRPSLAVPIVAGLLLGWAALAQADATPPAAPIFYCPTPGNAAPAAPTPAHAAHHAMGCPVTPVAHRSHGHARPVGRHRAVVASNADRNDVSASQAFIYRYERAVHGLDPHAAQQAWAGGGPAHAAAAPAAAPAPHAAPPAPGPMASASPPPHPAAPPQPPAAMHAPPPAPPPAARPAPPPCPQGCPGPQGGGGGGAMAQAAPPPRPSVHGYAWNDGHSGYAIEAQGMRSEREGGWSYSDVNGHRSFHRWGDRFAGEPGMGGGPGMGPPPGRPCPPAVPVCGGGGPPPEEVYEEAGRDAAGFLTWPGKTPAAW